MKLVCGHCDFETEEAEDIITHMVTTGHGMPPGVKADVVDSALFAEFVETIRKVQQNPACGTPMEEEDYDELPEDVKESIRKVEEREERRVSLKVARPGRRDGE